MTAQEIIQEGKDNPNMCWTKYHTVRDITDAVGQWLEVHNVEHKNGVNFIFVNNGSLLSLGEEKRKEFIDLVNERCHNGVKVYG